MSILVKTREEMKGLEAFLQHVEDDLISVIELYDGESMSECDKSDLVDAIRMIAGVRMNIDYSKTTQPNKFQKIVDAKVTDLTSEFDIAREHKVSTETVRIVKKMN